MRSREATADAAAVARCARGDAEGLREVYDRHGGLVYALALRLLGDRGLADECTQDVFLALWRGAARFDPSRARLSTWLFAVTRNRAIELHRRRAARPADLAADVELPSDAPDTAELVVDADRAQHVAEAMAGLPADQLAVLRLAYFEGLTQAEISERLGVPLGTVKSRVRLALERLRPAVVRYELGVER